MEKFNPEYHNELGDLYEQMRSYSFASIPEKDVLAAYNSLVVQSDAVLSQPEFRAAKSQHLENISSLLWCKLRTEAPVVASKIVQLVQGISAARYPRVEAAVVQRTEAFEDWVKASGEILAAHESEVQSEAARLLGEKVPISALAEAKRKTRDVAEKFRKAYVKGKEESVTMRGESWRSFCNYLFGKVETHEFARISARLVKKSVSIPALARLLSGIGRRADNAAKIYLEFRLKTMLVQNFFQGEKAAEEIVSSCKLSWGSQQQEHVWWRRHCPPGGKKTSVWAAEFARGIEACGLGREELAVVAFYLLLCTGPFCKAGGNELLPQECSPVDRMLVRYVVNKLRKHAGGASISLFLTWSNYLIFEAALGAHLRSRKLIEMPLPAVDGYNVLIYLRSHIPAAEIVSTLGKPDYDFLLENVSKLEWKFALESMTPDRRSVSTLVCVSGYLSEEALQPALWSGAIQGITEENLVAYQWPARTKANLGFAIAAGLIPHVFGNGNESTEGTLVKAFRALGDVKDAVFTNYKVASRRAKIAGKLLALVLHARYPFGYSSTVSLLGFSLGTKVISECIKTLSRLKATNLLCDVFLLGGAASLSNPTKWESQLEVVGGRVVNCYSKKDWVLQSLTVSEKKNPIGLHPILLPRKGPAVENFDVTDIAGGHLGYRAVLPQLIQKFYVV